jgi:PKD repeat protein
VKLFDNSNGGGVLNGGKAPSFDTKGKAYCVTSIVTYHWNSGLGKTPGTIGLTGTSKVGPFKAVGSAGQGGARNVNWTATVATTTPVVIDGTYSCADSDPATWSQNPQTGGKGFCIVYGVSAAGAAARTPPKVTATISTKVGAPVIGGAGAGKGGGKFSIRVTPDSGKPPLTVTFALAAPKIVQWRVDFGDGLFKTGFGQPPASLVHTYQREGDFKPKLTVLASQGGKASSATTSLSVHDAPLISLIANPPSGSPPLDVIFALSTTVQNITTWSLDFGDGQRTGGGGTPPAKVTHTYKKAGTFKPQLAVKPGAYALVYTVAQVTVGGGTPLPLGMTATPVSGKHPLTVRFALTTNIPGGVASWEVIFGDGARTSGQGAPPPAVSHIYAKAGNYAAFLVIAQQQQYGGVQYTFPRGGLAVSVG